METAAAVIGSAVLGKVMAPKPKKADTSALDEQKKSLADQEAKQKAESERLRSQQNDKLNIMRKRRMSKNSLITGSETGVAEKRETLG